MKITVDTGLLVRLLMADDAAQNAIALRAVEEASLVAIGVHSLCELAWVLHRHYGVPHPEIAGAIRKLIEARNVVVNRPAVEAGLEILEAGGDFADGVVAYEGRWLGGDTFVSFDERAVRLLEGKGRPAQQPA